jgi:hypothetical protein
VRCTVEPDVVEPDVVVPDVKSRGRPLLGIYLNDHVGAATGGLDLVRRTARAHAGTAAGEPLRRLASEIATDRRALLTIMRTLGVPVRGYKVAAGWAAEKVGRLKPNGRLWQRSPLSSVLELESLRIGIEGKKACWRVLRQLAQADRRLDAGQLDDLIARAERQTETVEDLRMKAAAETFGTSGSA